MEKSAAQVEFENAVIVGAAEASAPVPLPLPTERRLQIHRLAELAKDFDGTVERYLGPERAEFYRNQQREVASKRKDASDPAFRHVRIR